MAAKENEYWIDRFTQIEEAQNKAAIELEDEISRQYQIAQTEIERQISVWYQRYAVNNQVTMEEARRQLSTKELAEFRWTVDEYIRRGRENGVTADWSKQLENASARVHVTRLQALQLQLQNTVEVLYGGQTDALDALVKKTYLDSYYHTAFEIQRGVGVAWDIAGVNQKALAAVISAPWTTDGRNFSERIWRNQQALISELRTALSQNLMLGRPPSAAVKGMAARLGVSQHQAARLIHTESAYFQAVAQGDCYKALGVRKFVFVATLDDRTSEMCREMDGQVFDMKDYQPGVNVPPLHPWCRSCTAPHYEDLQGIGERAARDPDTGKTYAIPREIKYKEWEATFVKAEGTADQKQESGVKAANSAHIAANSIHVAAYRARITRIEDEELKNGLPLKGEPDSIVDRMVDGETVQRRIYDSDGMAMIDYDTTDHNQPYNHPTGAHKHLWDHSKKKPIRRLVDMTEEELAKNADIIKRGENYHDKERTDSKN